LSSVPQPAWGKSRGLGLTIGYHNPITEDMVSTERLVPVSNGVTGLMKCDVSLIRQQEAARGLHFRVVRPTVRACPSAR